MQLFKFPQLEFADDDVAPTGTRLQQRGKHQFPKAGYLLRGEYARYGEILYGVSIESLRKLGRPIDIFINDCYHSAACEANEDETIVDRLDAGGYVLGDSAHVTDKLEALARCTGRNFVLFKEQPYLHWYPRTGIGITFSPRETKGDTLSKQ